MNNFLEVFEITGDVTCVVDAEQGVVFWNTAAEELLGYMSSDAIGVECWVFRIRAEARVIYSCISLIRPVL